jgi:GAF domain-containing protein
MTSPNNDAHGQPESYAPAIAAVNDQQRLVTLRETDLLDAEQEEVFDRLTRLAVRLVGVPASFISLVDESRDFYLSACGFGEPLASSRELSGPTFCHYAIRSHEPLVIDDTAADPRYRDIPTVKSLGVAAYVGIPIVVNDQVIGSFCSIDMKPRHWTPEDVEVLRELAASAEREISLRAAVKEARALAAELEVRARELALQVEETEALARELRKLGAKAAAG